jgi:hypothetical protein
MKSTNERIIRYRKAYPDTTMTDKEIILHLNFGKQLKQEINKKFN